MRWNGFIVIIISKSTLFSPEGIPIIVSLRVLFLALKMFSSVRLKLQRKHSISRKRQKQRYVKFVWNWWQLLFWGVYCRERSSVFPVAQKSHSVNTQTSKGGQAECKPMIVQLFCCRFQNVLLSWGNFVNGKHKQCPSMLHLGAGVGNLPWDRKWAEGRVL